MLNHNVGKQALQEFLICMYQAYLNSETKNGLCFRSVLWS